MSLGLLRGLPPVEMFSRRFWEGTLGFARWFASRPRGRRALSSMLEQGLDGHLRDPLSFLLGAPLERGDAERRLRIEAFRSALLQRGNEQIETWATSASTAPAGPERRDVVSQSVSLRHVAAVGSILPYWGAFLLLCARSFGARAILELGACAGISSSYLAAASTCVWFTTVEGSEPLSQIAARNLAEINPAGRVLNRPFDEALDEILPELRTPLDLVFIDGEHTGRALRHYAQRLAPHVREGGVLLFDDIHWNDDMEEAWRAISVSEGNASSIDLGRLGMCVRGASGNRPQVFDFSPFTTFWRRGAPPKRP